MFFKISICKEEVMIKFMDQTLSLLDQILQWIVFGAFFIVGIIGTYNLFIVPVIGHVTMAFFIVVVILFMKLSAETTSMYSPGSNMNKTPQNKTQALAAFFAYASHNDLLKEKIDRIQGVDYTSLDLLEQLFLDKDNLSVLFSEVLENDVDPELFVE